MRRLWLPTLFVSALSLLVGAATIAAETHQPREDQKPAAGACADMMQQGGVTEEGKKAMREFMQSDRAPKAMANMMEMARRMGDGDVMLGMTRMPGARSRTMSRRALASVLGSLLTITLTAATLTAAAAAEGLPASAKVFDHVHARAFDAEGRTLWLGAHTGLFRSEDGGLTGTTVALPVTGHAPDVMAIAAHPGDVRTPYVGTHEAGVLADECHSAG